MTSIGASMCSDYTTPRLKKNARCLSRSQILGACPPCPQHVLLPNPLLVYLVLCAVGRLEVYAVVIRKVEEVVQHVRELLLELEALLPLFRLLAVEALLDVLLEVLESRVFLEICHDWNLRVHAWLLNFLSASIWTSCKCTVGLAFVTLRIASSTLIPFCIK